MKQLRMEKGRLVLLGAISFLVLALGYWLLPGVFYLPLLLGAVAFGVWLLYDEAQQVALTQEEQLSLLSDQTEDNLAHVLEHMPVGVVQFDLADKGVTWYNPYAALLLTKEDGSFDVDRVLGVVADSQATLTSNLMTIGNLKLTVSVDRDKQLLYFWDSHSFLRELQGLTDFSPVIMVVSVDNYDDITGSLPDAEVSEINGFVANFMADFAKSKKIFYRRADMDRFYLFTDYFVLSQLIGDKFSVLDQFRQAAQQRELGLTLSMGVSYGSHNHEEIGRVAHSNLNLAMVRGGDQLVLRDTDPTKPYQYFGGGSTSTVKRSRTRTRAMMSAISEKIKLADRVFVVGHKMTDMDALAASVGMAFFAKQLGAEAHAIYDPASMTEDVGRAIRRLLSEGNHQMMPLLAAADLVTAKSLLIMVDHSKLALTLSEPFYRQFDEVIIVDHHRRDEDFPANASLSFIESGASSASELVTELIQFQNAKKRISRLQASILMAGIMLDTNQFSNRVTSRTFDVASYLRRQGSDSLEIKAISAQQFEDYRQVNGLVVAAQALEEGQVMVATGADDQVFNNVVASKAADTLLDMLGVEASFVLVKTADNRVAISARSRQAINVQRIMERLGGGGHFSLAAAQVEATSIQEVGTMLQEAIKEEIKPTKES